MAHFTSKTAKMRQEIYKDPTLIEELKNEPALLRTKKERVFSPQPETPITIETNELKEQQRTIEKFFN